MPSSTAGFFSDNPQTEWLSSSPASPDREMKLLRDFFYVDPKGRKWLAPRDSIIDGASIPMPLWSSIGSPYTDDYRRASIVHDIACREPSITRKEADEMFYYACLAGGCSSQRAAVLYAGVRIGALFPTVEQSSDSVERGAELSDDNAGEEQKDALAEISSRIRAIGGDISKEFIDDAISEILER